MFLCAVVGRPPRTIISRVSLSVVVLYIILLRMHLVGSTETNKLQDTLQSMMVPASLPSLLSDTSALPSIQSLQSSKIICLTCVVPIAGRVHCEVPREKGSILVHVIFLMNAQLNKSYPHSTLTPALRYADGC